MDKKFEEFENAQEKIKALALLRKEVPKLIARKYEKLNKLQMDEYKNMEVVLKDIEVPHKIPDNEAFEELKKTENKMDLEYEKKLFEVIQLLDINTKTSSIQSIIDDI